MLGCISPGPVIGPSTVGISGTAAWAAASHAVSVTAETRAPVRPTQRRIVKLKLLPPFEMLMRLLRRTGHAREWESESGPEWETRVAQKKVRVRAPCCPSSSASKYSLPHHDYVLILLLKSNTRRFTIQIEVTHQFITHHNEYQLAATEGVRADRAPSEFFPRGGATVHHAIGNERAGARARGAARIPAVRPHDPQGRAHRIRHQVPADRGPQPARAGGGGVGDRSRCVRREPPHRHRRHTAHRQQAPAFGDQRL